jgi:DNA polymerase III, gamma/tau subunits
MDKSFHFRQPYVAGLLEKTFDRKRFSHAYLFEGERGSGKMAFALELAKMMLDSTYPTASAMSKMIDANAYANLYVITPDGATIKKEQITYLISELNKTSLVEGSRVYIIQDIEKMTASAANSLLKYFEEPHPNVYAILLTEQINQILKTIISRSQLIHFQAVSKNQLHNELLQAGVKDPYAALAPLVTSTFEEAMTLSELDEFHQMVEIIKELGNIMANRYFNAFIYFRDKGQFIGRDQIDLFLQLLVYYVKDVVNEQTSQALLYQDAKSVKELAKRPPSEWLQLLEFLMEQHAHLRYYPNVGLMLDRIMMRLDRRSYESS